MFYDRIDVLWEVATSFLLWYGFLREISNMHLNIILKFLSYNRVGKKVQILQKNGF